MGLAYLIDENLRGPLLTALMRTAVRLGFTLDVVRVGDAGAPPLRTLDAELLRWAESVNRIVISLDGSTLPDHLKDHLAAGRSCPGIILLRRDRLSVLTEHLVLIAFATDADEWRNQITYVP